MFKIGLSTTGKEICQALFENYIKAGITEAEISMRMDSMENYPSTDYKAIKRMADSSGVNLWTFHLPFKPFAELDISSSDRKLRNFSIKYTGELIRKAADIGIDKYVLHSGGITRRTTQAEVDERIKFKEWMYCSITERLFSLFCLSYF